MSLSISPALKKKYGNVFITAADVFEDSKKKKLLRTVPILDQALGGGLQEGSVTLISGDQKTCKAQPLDSLVYTPSGPKTMGSLCVGDEVCTPNNGVSKILQIQDQDVKNVYELVFNDHTTARCCRDHIWKVFKHHGKGHRLDEYKEISLDEIMNEGLYYSNRPKWRLELTEPIDFNKKDLPIDPYILGCLIGDGGLTHGCPIITSADEEIVNSFKEFAIDNNLVLTSTGKYSYRISDREDNKKNKLTEHLRDLGLMGCDSHHKFIPDVYKYSTKEDRLRLVRGLMDTDGCNSANKGQHANYTSVSYRLIKDMQEIVQSLGCTGKIKHRVTASSDKKRFQSFILYISGNNIPDLFSLPRKTAGKPRTKPNLKRTLKEVRYIGKQACRCIVLEDKTGLYLTDNFIVTHNSSLCLHLCKNAIEEGRPVAYFDTENRLRSKQLDGIHNLHEYRDKIFMPNPKGMDVWPAEQWLDIAEMLIKDPDNNGMVLIIDSASALITKSELEEEVSGQLRSGLPKTLSHWTKKISRAVPQNDIILVLVRHFIADTGPSRKTKIADGGRKLAYAADTILDVSYTQKWNESNTQVGHQIHWNIITSSNGGSNVTSESWLRYGKGIDIVYEYIELAKSINLVKGSTWMTLNYLENFLEEIGEEKWDESKYKFQGMKKTMAFFEENPLHFSLLKKEVDGLLLEQS